jgi:hypothetical protein
MRQKIIKSQVAFFSCCPLPHLFSLPAFQAGGGGDAHGRGGGDAQGGEGGCTCILCIPPGYATGSTVLVRSIDPVPITKQEGTVLHHYLSTLLFNETEGRKKHI